jgi:restriction endonuclease Mrr
MRHWDDRKLLSAQQAEDLVGSLLQEHHGGRIDRITANANAADGGIDLYLITEEDGVMRRAVQVKRRIQSDVESVTEVRNFMGAMVLENLEHGVFVTTASRFSKVARTTPKKAQGSKFKLNLELIDGERLFEILYATNGDNPAQLPPGVERDQEWRDRQGNAVSALDLFAGDFARWSKFGTTPVGSTWPQR